MFSNETHAALRQSIFEEFPKTAPPPYENLTSHHCSECDAVRDDFNGVKWWEAEYLLIYNNFAQACFFTSNAWHYYFPAFLLYSLDDPDPNFNNMIREYLIYGLQNSSQEIKNHFSDKQKRVVINFLEYILKDNDLEIFYDDVEKALSFWKQ